MSIEDTPRTLKDALTEGIQSALHYLRLAGDFADVKAQLSMSLDELYGHQEPPRDKLPYIRAGLEKADLALHSRPEAAGAITLIEEALAALDEAHIPPQTVQHAGASASFTVKDFRQAAPVREEDVKPSYEEERGKVIMVGGLQRTPNYLNVAGQIITELETIIKKAETQVTDPGGFPANAYSRLSALRKVTEEMTGDLTHYVEDAGRRRSNLEQVLTYVHRRLSTYPVPDGVVHLEFILRLASGLATLQSPPTGAEVGAALYRATELAHRQEGAENSLKPKRLVLDLDHDRYALPALEEYIRQARREGRKSLADGLSITLKEREGYYLPHSSTWELDHIPGSILEELEADINLVRLIESEDVHTNDWIKDNLERVRILRGCFAAYNTKASSETEEAEPEHEHNVMCLPYHSALREIERRINIYRDDTLEAHNDFGEGVVSKATVTAVNTFTAQVLKLIMDATGNDRGYNRGTIEREAKEDKGYPKSKAEGVPAVTLASLIHVLDKALRWKEGYTCLTEDFEYARTVLGAAEREAEKGAEVVYFVPAEAIRILKDKFIRGDFAIGQEEDKPLPGVGMLYAALVALRQDNELLRRENELQGASIIAYMFVVQRLRGCVRAFLDLYRAQIKAVGQIATGEYDEIKALAESALTMGEEELTLLAKACPSFKMQTTEGLTEY